MLNYTRGKVKEFNSAVDDETQSNKGINIIGDQSIEEKLLYHK